MNSGLIHSETDLKLLILYVLRRLPAPIDREALFEICICDNGVEYFNFAQYLDELTENGNVSVTNDDEYAITEKGIKNAEEVETSLPKSVRTAADKAIAPVVVLLKRYALIGAAQTFDENGVKVHLSLSDGAVELMKLDLFCGDDERAKLIRRSFRKNAEGYYSRILEMLTENKRKLKRQK